MTSDPPRKLEIDWFKTAGGAFAAVSSAFLLSTLGAAGTIIGAALGSVIVTVGGTLYSEGLARSQQRLARVQAAALHKVGVAQADVRRAARSPRDGEAVDAHLAHADERLHQAKDDLDALADEPADHGWRTRLRALSWKRISLVAAAFFATAVLAITSFEVVAGRPISSLTGGTDGGGGPTISRIGGGSGGSSTPDDQQTPSEDQSSPSDTPSSEPTDPLSPTSEPTTTDSTTTPEPTTPTTPVPATPTPSAPVPTTPAPTDTTLLPAPSTTPAG
jgi:hypothetical protein